MKARGIHWKHIKATERSGKQPDGNGKKRKARESKWKQSEAAGRQLAEYLTSKYVAGTMSARAVCEIAHLAAKAGAEGPLPRSNRCNSSLDHC